MRPQGMPKGRTRVPPMDTRGTPKGPPRDPRGTPRDPQGTFLGPPSVSKTLKNHWFFVVFARDPQRDHEGPRDAQWTSQGVRKGVPRDLKGPPRDP